jgi:Phytanoyl-CoA dioxygenase (PhyH)
MSSAALLKHGVEQHGFAIVPGVLDTTEQRELATLLGPVSGAGRRGLLGLPAVSALARSSRLLDIVRPHLTSEPLPVRAIYFDKSPDANWLVSWHQDLTLALRGFAEHPGFGPWSTKDGIPHVQPPVELLQQMLTIRLHLDDANESNGALRVLPGSHRLGRLSAERIQALRGEHSDFLCAVSAGEALVMRPLLLHASSRSTSSGHRRVLHIEYAAFALPSGLHWHEAA